MGTATVPTQGSIRLEPRGDNAMTSADLRARRRALGLTQDDLGRCLGIRRNTIARWERGDLAIGSPLLLRLALDHLAHVEASSERDCGPAAAAIHTLPEYQDE